MVVGILERRTECVPDDEQVDGRDDQARGRDATEASDLVLQADGGEDDQRRERDRQQEARHRADLPSDRPSNLPRLQQRSPADGGQQV